MIASAPLNSMPCPAPLAIAAGDPLPRVLYAVALDGSQKFGSLEEQIYCLASAFRDRGSLLLPLFVDAAGCGGGIAHFEEAGLPTAALSLWRFRWKTLWRLNHLIDKERIQLIHWNFYAPVFNSYLWLLSVLRPHVRHYFTDHNSRPLPLPPPPPRSLARWVKRLLLHRYRQVWCVSAFVENCLAQQKTWSNLKCCLHFINTDRFRPDSLVRQRVRQELGCENAFVVLTVANLILDKGVDVVLRAVKETPSDVQLWIVGTGHFAETLQSLSHGLGLQDRVRFLGQQVHVQPYMQAADCLACPSLWAEAAGLVNLEALSTGLPVLASRVGGIPEYVEDGQNGYLFTPGNHRELARLITEIRADHALCHRLGQAARSSAVTRFSVGARINDYLDLYRGFQ